MDINGSALSVGDNVKMVGLQRNGAQYNGFIGKIKKIDRQSENIRFGVTFPFHGRMETKSIKPANLEKIQRGVQLGAIFTEEGSNRIEAGDSSVVPERYVIINTHERDITSQNVDELASGLHALNISDSEVSVGPEADHMLMMLAGLLDGDEPTPEDCDTAMLRLTELTSDSSTDQEVQEVLARGNRKFLENPDFKRTLIARLSLGLALLQNMGRSEN